MPDRQNRCFVSGRVQGVCFRARTVERARQLGLRGFVRNLADGRVEVVAGGRSEDVTDLIGWLWAGPEMAEVSGVAVESCNAALPSGFEQAKSL